MSFIGIADGIARRVFKPNLSGLLWAMPIVTMQNATSGTVVVPAPVITTLVGIPGHAYAVTLRFRGVVERKTYNGGSNDGAFWQIGGTPAADVWNWYRMDISSPSQTFYLNNGTSGQTQVWLMDYTKTITINGGATITLTPNDGGDGAELANNSFTGGPLTVPSIPYPVQPYAGQFIRMDTVSIVP